MKIELRATEKVRPYEKNPRLNDGAVAAVARSLQEFGFRQPIVVDAEGVRARRYGPDGVELPGLAAAPVNDDEEYSDLTTENTPAEEAGVGEG